MQILQLTLFLNIFGVVQQQDVVQDSFPSPNFDLRVVLHHGVPSTASILAFDHIQRLLAVGTLWVIIGFALEQRVLFMFSALLEFSVSNDTEMKFH